MSDQTSLHSVDNDFLVQAAAIAESLKCLTFLMRAEVENRERLDLYQALLRIRSMVLARTLAATVICRTSNEVQSGWPTEPLNLIVLCHTLNDAARRMLLLQAREKGFAERVLQIESGIGFYATSEAFATVEADPQRMVRQVSRMLVN